MLPVSRLSTLANVCFFFSSDVLQFLLHLSPICSTNLFSPLFAFWCMHHFIITIITIIILGQLFWFSVQQGASFMEQQLISTFKSFKNVRTSSEGRQHQDGDILKPNYILKMHEEVKISFHQNDCRELKPFRTIGTTT